MSQRYSNPLINSLMRDGSALNKSLKSMSAVICTIIFTYLIYSYLRYQVRADAIKATITLCVLFPVLLIGLTSNSPKFRCIVLLTLPYMASSRGRAIILMNCATLTTNTVMPNILRNFEQIQRTFICNRQLVCFKLLFFISMKIVKDNDDISLYTS